MECIYERTESMRNVPSSYCPGCFHGITQKLMMEVIDEMGLREKSVLATCIGCSGMGAWQVNIDSFSNLHGRAAAGAVGLKAVNPDLTVFCYQGDGDAAAIGLAETISTARRGDPVTVIFANNTVFGMTGGQVAPTTLHGQKTITTRGGSPYDPIYLPEMIATLDAPMFVARCGVHTAKHILDFKKCLKEAILCQNEKKGYSMIEVLCACPTNVGFQPNEGPKYIDEVMAPVFPFGIMKRDGKRI